MYDPASGTINLIDFGAARDYPPHFVADYLRMVRACAERDRDEVIRRSTSLGFLTGARAGGWLGGPLWACRASCCGRSGLPHSPTMLHTRLHTCGRAAVP